MIENPRGNRILEAVCEPEQLSDYVAAHLSVGAGEGYVCPACGAGERRGTVGVVASDGQWRCRTCKESGDLPTLIGLVEGIEGDWARLVRATQVCGLPAPTAPSRQGTAAGGGGDPSLRLPEMPDYDVARNVEALRVREWQEAGRTSPEMAEYLRARGIEDYPCAFGYDAERARLVIPYPLVPWCHVDRDVTGRAASKYEAPGDAVGELPLFRTPFAYEEEQSIVVVEGALDAYALQAAGINAVVALCGTGHRQLVRELRREKYQGGVLLMLDHDEVGEGATERVERALKEVGIPVSRFAWAPGDGKDADEIVSRGGALELNRRLALSLDLAAQAARDDAEGSDMRLTDPLEILSQIYFDLDPDLPIPTGFPKLDAMLDGGLVRGLYVLGGTSSFGKTTLSLQIADNVASQGHPVLFVTIEQASREIVAKSLSRLTHDRHNTKSGGLSSQQILRTKSRRDWTQENANALMAASNAYADTVRPNLRFVDMLRKPSVAEIRVEAERMRTMWGESPVVMIDYLQLLAPKDAKASDKMAVDANVTDLRIMAKVLKAPVWCVASLNRDSYSGPVELDSYKESGAVEFGGDCLLGLQPAGIAKVMNEVKSAIDKRLKGNAYISKAKRDTPRKVELTVLKNRQGETTGSECGIQLHYHPRTNLFQQA